MIQIRRAGSDDADQIIVGINLICAEGGAFYTTRFVSSPTWETVLYQPQTAPDHLLAIAEWSGVFAGSCRLFPEPEQSYSYHVLELGMFVLSPYRRRGIGQALLKWGMAWAAQQAFEKINLSVFTTNIPAIKLYQSLGFVEEGRRVRQIKTDTGYIDLVLMTRHL